MRIVVASCWKYRDAWKPFFALLDKFWPQISAENKVDLLTDHVEDFAWPVGSVYLSENKPWSHMVAEYAGDFDYEDGLLLLQDDFFINAPVNQLLIKKGLEQLQERNAAMVRLYPCPGGDIPYGDKWYAEIPKGAAYRVSCQATIWRPDVLHKIAFTCDTPADFEIRGSKVSNEFDEPFLAFKREAQPWPLSYICSAISRSKWNPQALEFCRQQGIAVDTSMREVAC